MSSRRRERRYLLASRKETGHYIRSSPTPARVRPMPPFLPCSRRQLWRARLVPLRPTVTPRQPPDGNEPQVAYQCSSHVDDHVIDVGGAVGDRQLGELDRC
jgi:hypothetical protein